MARTLQTTQHRSLQLRRFKAVFGEQLQMTVFHPLHQMEEVTVRQCLDLVFELGQRAHEMKLDYSVGGSMNLQEGAEKAEHEGWKIEWKIRGVSRRLFP